MTESERRGVFSVSSSNVQLLPNNKTCKQFDLRLKVSNRIMRRPIV